MPGFPSGMNAIYLASIFGVMCVSPVSRLNQDFGVGLLSPVVCGFIWLAAKIVFGMHRHIQNEVATTNLIENMVIIRDLRGARGIGSNDIKTLLALIITDLPASISSVISACYEFNGFVLKNYAANPITLVRVAGR